MQTISPSSRKSPVFGRQVRSFGETFKRFMACLQWAREGKTFIYHHPDFIAIDRKTWDKIQAELRPPIEQQVIYDEYANWTPKMEARLNKYMAGRLSSEHQAPAKASPKAPKEKGKKIL